MKFSLSGVNQIHLSKFWIDFHNATINCTFRCNIAEFLIPMDVLCVVFKQKQREPILANYISKSFPHLSETLDMYHK